MFIGYFFLFNTCIEIVFLIICREDEMTIESFANFCFIGRCRGLFQQTLSGIFGVLVFNIEPELCRNLLLLLLFFAFGNLNRKLAPMAFILPGTLKVMRIIGLSETSLEVGFVVLNLKIELLELDNVDFFVSLVFSSRIDGRIIVTIFTLQITFSMKLHKLFTCDHFAISLLGQLVFVVDRWCYRVLIVSKKRFFFKLFKMDMGWRFGLMMLVFWYGYHQRLFKFFHRASSSYQSV